MELYNLNLYIFKGKFKVFWEEWMANNIKLHPMDILN